MRTSTEVLGKNRERLLPFALAALAFTWVVVSIEPYPVGVFQDDGIYTMLAKSIASGQGYRYLNLPDAPSATHYPPLYPLLLAALWKVFPSFPENVTLFKFANAGLAALTALFGWRFARRNLGMSQWVAFGSVGAFTVCTPVVFVSVMVMSEPLFMAMLFPVLMACERAVRTENYRDAVIAGVAGSVFALVRTLGAAVIPATVLALAWRRRWGQAALVFAAAAVAMVPWQLWVAAHSPEIPAVLAGKYGSYFGWLLDGMKAGGVDLVVDTVLRNLTMLSGLIWATIGFGSIPTPARWIGIVLFLTVLVVGWVHMRRRAPVAAWMAIGYLSIVLIWPFTPVRFVFAVWPLLGLHLGLGVAAIVEWRPAPRRLTSIRFAGLIATCLLAIGYVRFNYRNQRYGWWSDAQETAAARSKHLAEWVRRYTPEDVVIATEDDVLIYLYTGRRALPLATFTTREHTEGQSTAFSTETLRAILSAYDVDYVLASTDFGARAAGGLVDSSPPILQFMGKTPISGAVFRTVTRGGS